MQVDSSTLTRPVADLKPNPLNPRGELDQTGLQELAESIKSQGVLQPLLVTPEGLVVAGHRRLAASRMAGLARVPVLVREMTETQQLQIMLVENIQREALTVLQEARAFRHLLDSGMGRGDVARKLGINTARIQSRLQLLQLDDDVQGRFDRSELPMTLAPILVKVANRDQQRRLATIAATRKLTVPELERIVERGAGALSQPPPKVEKPPRLPSPVDHSESRQKALELLKPAATKTITVGRFKQLVEATCCACGMSFSPSICSACPLLDLVKAVGREVAV